jgi:DNA invertase Pin-like site-specific DNA recombinase
VTSKNTAPKRAVVYCRLSRDRNKDKQGEGMKVADQEADCRDLAGRLGFTVAAVRTDNDLTAFKGTARSKPRPGYDALLDDIESGRADVVLAWHTDRLHRDLSELEHYVDVCETRKVPTHTVKGGDLDLSTASGRMVARILGSVARGEVEHMIERMESGKDRCRRLGAWPGGARPFGYEPDGPSVRLGGEEAGRLAQVPDEAAAIKRAYKSVLAGVTLAAIARDWNRRGLRTPQSKSKKRGGKPWHAGNVKPVLVAARNAGLIEFGGEIIGEAHWPAIVHEDTWRTARAILTDPSRRTAPGPKPAHLLTGVLICGVCGGRKFRAGHVKDRWLYQCAAKAIAPGMGTRFHLACHEAGLDEAIEAAIIDRLSKPDAVAAFAAPAVDIAALDARRTALNAELDAFAREPGITPRQLSTVSAPKIAEVRYIEQQISDALHGSALEEFNGATDPAKVWARLSMERKRAVAATMLRVLVKPARRGGGKAGRKMPPGWRFGMPMPFDTTRIDIIWQSGAVDDQQPAGALVVRDSGRRPEPSNADGRVAVEPVP